MRMRKSSCIKLLVQHLGASVPGMQVSVDIGCIDKMSMQGYPDNRMHLCVCIV